MCYESGADSEGGVSTENPKNRASITSGLKRGRAMMKSS